MILQLPGGVCFSEKTNAWKHSYTLPDAGRVYLSVPSDQSYRLLAAKDEPVRIGSPVALLQDGSHLYATVSGTFDGIFQLRDRYYLGISDNGQRMTIPVIDPETRPLGEIPKEELLSAVRDLSVFDTRRNDLLWRTLSARTERTRRVIVDLTDTVNWSFTNYMFAMENIESILSGAKILCYLLGASKIVLVTDALRKKLGKAVAELIREDPVFSLAEVSARYPVCEQSLLTAIYNLPAGTTDPEMFFVSGPSSAQLYTGLMTGFAHTEQLLTVSGPGFGKPCVLRVPVGTTWKAVLRFCQFKGGSYKTKVNSPLTGRPATGICRTDDECVFSAMEQTAAQSDCISCGRCARVCPAGLHPFRILGTKNVLLVKTMAARCLQCGCCSFACPSCIPLNELISVHIPKKEDDPHA